MSTENKNRQLSITKLLLYNLLLAICWAGMALLASHITLQPDLPPIIWPACGVALGFFILFGVRLWPGLLVGSIAGIWLLGEQNLSLVIHVVAHLTATFVGYYFLQLVDFHKSLQRVHHTLNYFAIAVFGSALISTLILGAGISLLPTSKLSDLALLEFLEMHWLAEILGLLIITPLLLIWSNKSGLRNTWQTWVEGTILTSGVVVATFASFSWVETPHIASYPFIVFPFVIWAALRFTQHGTVLATLLVSTIAISGTMNNWGVFASPYSPTTTILGLQAFLSIVAVTGLILAAVASERDQSLAVIEDSASRYRMLFEHNPQPMLLYRLDSGKITDANRSAIDCFGFSKSQLLEFSIGKLLEQSNEYFDTQEFLELPAGNAKHLELPLATASGDSILCNCIAQRILYAGELTGILIAEDVTEQIQTREALHDLKQKLTLHMQQTALGVIEWTPDFKIIEWNPAAEKIFGYTAEEIKGQTGHILLPDSAKASIEALWQNLTQDHGGTYSVNQNITKSGRTIICEWFNTPLIDRRGTVIGVESVMHDITAREQAEEALRDSESKFRNIIESSPMGIHIFQLQQPGDELVLIGANSAADRILATKHADKLGLPISEALPELTETDIPDRYREVAKGSEPWNANQLTYLKNEFSSAHELTAFRTSPGTVVAMFLDVTERRLAEQNLKLREKALESITQGIIIQSHDPANDHPIIYANPAFMKITGFDSQELLGETLKALYGETTEPSEQKKIEAAMFEKHSAVVDLQLYRKDKTTFQSSLSISPIKNAEHTVTHFVTVLTDVSELRTLEAQFRQSQKMDAIGRLAGGVAHDFNNLLTAIIGYTDQIIDELPENSRLWDNANEVQRAADRASDLTKQLLAFSRQQSLQPRISNLNEIIEGLQNMLTRLIGEDIQIRTELADDLYPIKCEPSQIEQVIMNMAINARDAMNGTGTLSLRTSMVSIRDTEVNNISGLSSGDYTVLSISDNGCGMTREVQEHLYEPFFTTKEKGKGTGLGLATCYGIIKQNGGFIKVHSAPGKGATFDILLPAMDRQRVEGDSVHAASSKLGGVESILVVEDDDAVRPLTTSILKSLGYNVTEAANGQEAIAILTNSESGSFDLVITDVVMPKMGGQELAVYLHENLPGVAILFTSGYIDTPMSQINFGNKEEYFLQKPFTPMDLARKVRSVLDAAASSRRQIKSSV